MMNQFPASFLWGASSSASQIEGGWDEGGKGMTVADFNSFKLSDKQGAMDAIKEHFENQEKPTAFMDFDGYRVEFNDWWFNIRPSNTEPYLRFICEATSKELLDEKVNEVKEILKTKFSAEV